MDLDREKVKEKITEYKGYKSCSQSTLMGLCEVADLPMSLEELSALGVGFSGGIGGTVDEGTCGAVTGAIMAFGLLGDDEAKIKANSKELFEDFKKEFSTVKCGSLTGDGADMSPCLGYCIFAGNKAVNLLKD